MMKSKWNLFFKRYAIQKMWGAGGCIVLALAWKHFFELHLVANGLFLIAVILAGCPILSRAFQGLRFKVIGIEFLVSIAVCGALLVGELSEAAIVTFLFQIGEFLEQKTMSKTRSAIKELTNMAPKTAWKVVDGKLKEISADEVEVGNRLLVKTGGQIAADGVILSGDGYVNESSITGESRLQHKSEKTTVYAGTILESGTLEMEACKVGEDTTFSRIVQLVEEAQDAKSPVERFVDRFAKYYTPAVVGFALMILVLSRNIDTAITVLVLACPGALVIGAPIANVAGIGRGARAGILLKGGDSIHSFAKTDVIVFDKTGTLTTGSAKVTNTYFYTGDREEILALTASAELAVDHPLAKAIVAYVRDEKISVEYCAQVEQVKGMGVVACVQNRNCLVGNEKLLRHRGVNIEEHVQRDVCREQEHGASTVLIALDGKVSMMLAISDDLKPQVKESISALKRMGIRKTILMTGDNPKIAKHIAEQVEISEVYAELLPQDKAQMVQKLQNQGYTVTFVGDGINDSPALVNADTGIAVGQGTDVAIESSDVVLIKSELQSLVHALRLAKQTEIVMYENIVIAVGTVLLLLVGLIAGYVHMTIGMFIHEASILLVIINAMRLAWGKGEEK